MDPFLFLLCSERLLYPESRQFQKLKKRNGQEEAFVAGHTRESSTGTSRHGIQVEAPEELVSW